MLGVLKSEFVATIQGGTQLNYFKTPMMLVLTQDTQAVSRQRKWDTLGPRVKRELKGLRGWDPTPSKGCT